MMMRVRLSRLVQRQGLVALLLLSLCGVACAGLPQMKTIPITHPYDAVIHGWSVDDLAGETLDRTGEADVSAQLNRAIKKLFDAGGGTLYLPAGKYRLDQPVFVRPGTALRGDFVQPGADPVDVAKNTIICAYYGREMDELAEPLFIQDGSSLIDGLVIWYPEQNERNVVPYAPSIRQVRVDSEWAINSAARNIFFVNAYTGIQLGASKRGTCIELVKNMHGTPLRRGVEVWRDADIPRILNVDFNPDYWPAAKLGHKAISLTALKKHLFQNASGITYHRTDGSALANITIRGYHRGLELADGHRSNKFNLWLDNEGHYINFNITECYDAVWIQNIKNHGTQFYNSVLEGKRAAVYVENPMHGMECAMFMGCTLSGGDAALMQEWKSKPNDKFSLMFSACNFESSIQWTGGNLIVADSDFNFWKDHLSIGPDAKSVIIADCRFKGESRIDNRARAGRVKMSEPREPYINAPDHTYDVNKISTYKPPQTETVFVAAGDGKADDTQRIQQAVDEVSGKGGGYVVLTSGLYMLKGELVVRENVELRGPVQSWQHTKFLSLYAEQGAPKSVIIFVETGRDAEESAAITLEQNAGLDGFCFHYPGQEYSTETKEVLHKYGWLIRMQGDRSYVKHVTASNPWRFIDLVTHDAKDTYIGYCTGAPLQQGIHVGEAENCMIDNVHFNSWYWNTVSFPNKPSEKGKNAYKEDLDNWMKANTKAFIFAGSRNLDVYGSFIFCSYRAFNLLPGETSGKGPDGIIINSGCDWSKFGVTMHANNGLVFVNTHLIDVGQYDPDQNISSIYVAEGCADSIEFFNLSTWGTSHRALALYGTSTSRVDIYNFSNQLYDPQVNTIQSGSVRIVSSTRNVPKYSTTFDLGPDASVITHAGIYDAPVRATPLDMMQNNTESVDVTLSDVPPGLINSHSFP